MSSRSPGAADVAAPAFTPSEQVVLLGDRFAPAARGMLTRKFETLTGATVQTEAVATAAIVAAVLAAEEAGALRMEARTRKALFGLTKKTELFLAPGPGGAAYPEGTLEAAVAAAARAGDRRVKDAIETFLETETPDPWLRLCLQVHAGLDARGLVETKERKVMKLFTTSTYVLPETTRAAVLAVDTAPVAARRQSFAAGRADLAALLDREIGAAMSRMTESGSADNDWSD